MTSVFNTFLGNFSITETDNKITGAQFVDEEVPEQIQAGHENYVAQLKQYFKGSLKHPEIPIEAVGTPFQIAVWKEVCSVPYGKVATYGEIAKKVGKGANPRNVGQANGQNKLSILVPCHRIVAKHMELAGYAWGLERKRKLLQLEGALKQFSLFD